MNNKIGSFFKSSVKVIQTEVIKVTLILLLPLKITFETDIYICSKYRDNNKIVKLIL